MFLQKLKAVPKNLTGGFQRVFLRVFIEYDSRTYRVIVPTYVPVDYLHLSFKILSLRTAACNFPDDLFGTRLEKPTAGSHCRRRFSTTERKNSELKSGEWMIITIAVKL